MFCLPSKFDFPGNAWKNPRQFTMLTEEFTGNFQVISCISNISKNSRLYWPPIIKWAIRGIKLVYCDCPFKKIPALQLSSEVIHLISLIFADVTHLQYGRLPQDYFRCLLVGSVCPHVGNKTSFASKWRQIVLQLLPAGNWRRCI
jgi:hypothetical protein